MAKPYMLKPNAEPLARLAGAITTCTEFDGWQDAKPVPLMRCFVCGGTQVGPKHFWHWLHCTNPLRGPVKYEYISGNVTQDVP